MALKISDIPKLFKEELDVRIPETQPDASEHCLFCRRHFQPPDSEESDEYCKPMQIYPCKHFIGAECLPQLLNNNITDCQYCRTGIQPSSSASRWIQWIASCRFYSSQVDLVVLALEHDTPGGEVPWLLRKGKARLVEAIRDHTFNISDAVHVCLEFIGAHIIACSEITVMFGCMQIAFWSINMISTTIYHREPAEVRANFWKDFFGTEPTTEAMIIGLVTCVSLALNFALEKWGGQLNARFLRFRVLLCLFCAARAVFVLLGWKILACLLIANEVFYTIISVLMVGFALWKVWMARQQ
jgi:hypothetical protein